MRLATLALAATLAACGGKGGMLSVSTKVTGNAAATGGGATTALAIGTHVTLDRARFLVRKVVLEGEPGEGMEGNVSTTENGGMPGNGGGEGDDSDSMDETVVRLGPLVIDLSGTQLDGGVTFLFDEPVPAGTFDELRFQIHPLTPGETVTDPDFTAGGHSILLDLMVDGTPFTFTSDLTAVSEIEGPFTVAAGANANVTVTIDPSGWFKAADGSFLDPRVDANRSQIEQNLRASIRGFQDDDHDGEPDHH